MLDALADRPGSAPGFTSGDNLANALLARSETGLLALDPLYRVVLANAAAREFLGVSAALDGLPLPDLLRQGRLGSIASAIERWLDSGADGTLLVPVEGDGKLSIKPMLGPDGHLLLAVKRVSRLAAPAERRDQLTGLSDRAWFLEGLTSALAAPDGQPALLMLDLDRFKAVNDSLGHLVGDALLQLVGKRLTGALRNADVISRLSGDEFAIVMKRPRDPEAVGRRLVALLSRPYVIEGTTVTIGASVGIALGPEHGADPVALIGAADVALYAAKNGGRGSAKLFDAALEAATRERHQMAEALRKAVPRRQFELHFQPQMVLETGRLSGFEAFLRWNHPEFGVILPPKFLPIAETTGLIWLIGEWVLQRACEEAIGWPSHLSVSVNVSVRQLMGPASPAAADQERSPADRPGAAAVGHRGAGKRPDGASGGAVDSGGDRCAGRPDQPG